PRDGKTRRADLLIRDGRIAGIGEDLDADGVRVYDAAGRLISPGWFDMHVHLREPGQEHKETIQTGARAAAFGGFTGVACMPNTDPPIASRDVVEFVVKRAAGLAVDVHPIGAVSKGRRGEALAELGDMADGGAVAWLLAEFTGGHVHVCHTSTAKAVGLVRQAKAAGVPMTAEAAPHHFALTDEAVEASGFDTHTKMHPPLRTAADVEAVKEGLR